MLAQKNEFSEFCKTCIFPFFLKIRTVFVLKSTSDKKTSPFLGGQPFWKIVLDSFESKLLCISILNSCNDMTHSSNQKIITLESQITVVME